MKRPVVFLRNPKAASTSIADVMFRNKAYGLGRHPGFDKSFLREKLTTGSQLLVVPVNLHDKLEAMFPLDLLRDTFIFTCFRNPFSRYISAWSHCRKREWVPVEVTPAGMLREPHVLKTDVKWHLISQSPMLQMCGRDISFGMRYERLAEDFEYIIGELGLAADKLPHLNAGHYDDWKLYYQDNPDLLPVIYQRYVLDFISLGYPAEITA